MADPGYTWRDGHPQRRAAYLAQLKRDGYLVCWRCGGRITDPAEMHVGHDDYDRSITRGPEDRLCNLRAAADKTNGKRNEPKVTRRDWGNEPSAKAEAESGGEGRLVVVLCGPPGAGKTTAARASGLDVYDRDNYSGEQEFSAALDAVRSDESARAVVIRWAPSSKDRARIVEQVAATHCYLVTTDPATLRRRIVRRGRSDATQTLAGLATWQVAHDRADMVQPFPGWPAVLGARRDW